MKKIVATIAIIVITWPLIYANNTSEFIDSTTIASQETSINRLQEQVKELSGTINALRHSLSQVKSEQDSFSVSLGSVQRQITKNDETLNVSISSLCAEIDKTKDTVNSLARVADKKIANCTLWGGLLCFVLIFAFSLVFLFLRKKLSSASKAIESIKRAQTALQSESIKLDEELVRMFDLQLSNSANINAEQHSLVLTIANELARMETNLSRMDSSVKGYRQLSSALKRMKENLSANGYEFVDMLGKSYHEGMVVDADFVADDSIEDGQQIITGVTKPQVNYNGKMIQSAKITVSQNL